MGNVESNMVINNKNNKNNKNNTKIKVDEIDILVEDITRTAKRLWRNYQKDFLNHDFCKNVELSYKNKLSGLNLTQLKNINNKINDSDSKKFDIYLKYNPKTDEKFIVEGLKTEVIDLFYNNLIQFDKDKVQLSYALENMKYIKPGLNYTQKGGQNYENTKKKLQKLLDIDTKNNNKNNNNNNNNNNIESTKELQEINKIFANLKDDKPSTNNKNNKPNKPNRETKMERENKPNRPNKSNRPNRETKMERENRKYIKEIERMNVASENIMNYKFPTCNENTERCELTKNELCKAISRNYIVRSNIIAAILSTLPSRDENGRYIVGFCQNKLKSLEQFKICLPPGFKDLDKLSKEDRMKELVKYIDNIDENDCRGMGGYYKSLTKNEIEALMTGNNEFNLFYKKFSQQMRKQYTESLRNLLGILDLLENETTINNKILNDIGRKTKIIIDDMYTKCHMNYMYAVLAYLKADVETTQKTLQDEKAIINALQEKLI